MAEYATKEFVQYAVQQATSGSGTGDMLKSTYDTNADGVVNAADSVPWTGVIGKPATFTPEAHTHTVSQITDMPTIPDQLSDLSDDSTHRLATDTEKSTWNGKQDALGFTPVPNTRTVNSKPLSSDVTLSASDVGAAVSSHTHSASAITDFDTEVSNNTDVAANTSARHTHANFVALAAISGTNTGDQDLSGLVPNTRTVNGHALSSNVAVLASDVGLGNVTNESKATMFTDAALTGTPTAPTAADGTNTTQIASTAFVQSAVSAAGGGDMLAAVYDTHGNETDIFDYADEAGRWKIIKDVTITTAAAQVDISVSDIDFTEYAQVRFVPILPEDGDAFVYLYVNDNSNNYKRISNSFGYSSPTTSLSVTSLTYWDTRLTAGNYVAYRYWYDYEYSSPQESAYIWCKSNIAYFNTSNTLQVNQEFIVAPTKWSELTKVSFQRFGANFPVGQRFVIYGMK